MKRTFAVVALLAALGALAKLTLKPSHLASPIPPHAAATITATALTVTQTTAEDELIARYQTASAADRDLVVRTVQRYRQNAVAIERSAGLRGLKLLDRLDLEAIFLFEKHPGDFHRLRDALSDNDDAAADVLLHWREYFGLKRADETDRKILIAELEALDPAQRRLAARFPSALPLILADPEGVTELLSSSGGDDATIADQLAILGLIDLAGGAADIRAAIRTLEDRPALAMDAFRQFGPEGFAMVSLHGPLLDALGASTPLEESLVLLRVNADYVDELLSNHQPETVARHLAHVRAVGLVKEVGGGPNGLRLAVEYGSLGEKALAKAGADAADVAFDDFADPVLRRQAVAAMAEHGTLALAMLEKYAVDPDFREVLRRHGPAVIPPIARADVGPEALALLQSKERRSLIESLTKTVLYLSGGDGQSTIRTIRDDGLERVASLGDQELRYYQFLPLYDVLHLGNVVRRGYAPTSGELAWAMLDGCFVMADALSLATIQPEAVVAVEAARTEVKAAVRESARSAGRDLVEAGTAAAAAKTAAREAGDETARHVARWWTVRAAGGVFEVLRRAPEALGRMSLSQIAQTARPLCARAGLRLSGWGPVTLLRGGVEVVLRVPPERGLKYLGAQLAQAGVGVVAMHKMEEHLASRRPKNP